MMLHQHSGNLLPLQHPAIINTPLRMLRQIGLQLLLFGPCTINMKLQSQRPKIKGTTKAQYALGYPQQTSIHHLARPLVGHRLQGAKTRIINPVTKQEGLTKPTLPDVGNNFLRLPQNTCRTAVNKTLQSRSEERRVGKESRSR